MLAWLCTMQLPLPTSQALHVLPGTDPGPHVNIWCMPYWSSLHQGEDVSATAGRQHCAKKIK